MPIISMEEYLAEKARKDLEEKIKRERPIALPPISDPVNGGSWENLFQHGTQLGAKVQLYNGYCNYWMPNNMEGYSDFEFAPLDPEGYERLVRTLRQFLGKHKNFLNYKIKDVNRAVIIYYRVQRFAGLRKLQNHKLPANIGKISDMTATQANALNAMLEQGLISFDAPKETARFSSVSEIDSFLDYLMDRTIDSEEKRDRKAKLTEEERERIQNRLDVKKYIAMVTVAPDIWPLHGHTLEQLQEMPQLPGSLKFKKNL